MAAHQAPPSLGFSRREHWSGLPFPSPMHESEKWKWSRSVVSDSSRPMSKQKEWWCRLLYSWWDEQAERSKHTDHLLGIGGVHMIHRDEGWRRGLTDTNLNCLLSSHPLSPTSLHGGWNFLNKQAHESFLYGKEKSVLSQPSLWWM